MFPEFLPPEVVQLKEPTAINLAKNIKRQAIATPLHQQPIATAYVQQGSGGTPILLLHGFDNSLLEFHRLIPLLTARNETWAIDLLGFGFTGRMAGLSFAPHTIKTHLYYSWQQLINQPVILIGTSMGGATAIDFTLTYPQAVKKLVLINSFGYTGAFLLLGKLLFPPLESIAVEYWRQRKLGALNLASWIGYNSDIIETLKCVTLHTSMPNWHEAMISFTKSGGYYWLENEIAKINKPTLILWGELDDTLGNESAFRFQRDIVNSKLVWVKNCGHVPQIEKPQVVAEEVYKFCEL